MGNHEHMMLAAVAGTDKEAPDHWLMNGGADSLLSWGISRTVPPAEWAAASRASTCFSCATWRSATGSGHICSCMPASARACRWTSSRRQDMMWIREPFLSSRADHGVVVVHGHTPKREPIVQPNRIAIDTGAVLGGALTCVVLEEDKLGFLQS